MASTNEETVWIGNYVNLNDKLIFEVQMLTDTKEEAYEKYVKYYKEEIYDSETGEGDENYLLCTIDALVEGRSFEELNDDGELSWFYGEEIFVDGEKGMDHLDEDELEDLMSKIVKEEPLVTEKDLAWVRDLSNQNNPGGVEKFKDNLVIRTSQELDEDGLEGISLTMFTGEALEDFIPFTECPDDFRGGYIDPEIFKHLVGKLYGSYPEGLYEFILTSKDFNSSELYKVMNNLTAAYWVSIEHVTYTGISISRSVNVKSLYDHIESHWSIQTKIDNLYEENILEEDEYNHLMNTFSNCGYGYLFGSDLLCKKDYKEINIKFYFDSEILKEFSETKVGEVNDFLHFVNPFKTKFHDMNSLLVGENFENLYRHICYFTDLNIHKKKQCVLFTVEENVSIETFRAIRDGLDPDEIGELALVENYGGSILGEDTSASLSAWQVKRYNDEMKQYLREDIKVLGFGLVKYGKTLDLRVTGDSK